MQTVRIVTRGISMFTLVGLRDVKLIDPLLDQGHQLFVDNFYTSPILLKNLFLEQTPETVAITENHKGCPTKIKGGKSQAKRKERGAMRWERTEECLV